MPCAFASENTAQCPSPWGCKFRFFHLNILLHQWFSKWHQSHLDCLLKTQTAELHYQSFWFKCLKYTQDGISSKFPEGNDATSQRSYIEHHYSISGLAHILYKAPDSKYFKSSPRQYVDTWVWLCFSHSLFMDPDIWI